MAWGRGSHVWCPMVRVSKTKIVDSIIIHNLHAYVESSGIHSEWAPDTRKGEKVRAWRFSQDWKIEFAVFTGTCFLSSFTPPKIHTFTTDSPISTHTQFYAQLFLSATPCKFAGVTTSVVNKCIVGQYTVLRTCSVWSLPFQISPKEANCQEYFFADCGKNRKN